MVKITLIGLYNYNDSLFDNLSLPNGIDRSTCISSILINSGEFEIIYSDFEFNKAMIGYLSKKWERTFTKWVNALNLSYEPIENYDRREEWTDDGSSSGNASSTDNAFVTAYESDELHQDSLATGISSSSGTANSTHKGRVHGNIGVTTSQQMLKAELDIDEWNLYQHIADIFVKELCIMVY